MCTVTDTARFLVHRVSIEQELDPRPIDKRFEASNTCYLTTSSPGCQVRTGPIGIVLKYGKSLKCDSVATSQSDNVASTPRNYQASVCAILLSLTFSLVYACVRFSLQLLSAK